MSESEILERWKRKRLFGFCLDEQDRMRGERCFSGGPPKWLRVTHGLGICEGEAGAREMGEVEKEGTARVAIAAAISGSEDRGQTDALNSLRTMAEHCPYLGIGWGVPLK